MLAVEYPRVLLVYIIHKYVYITLFIVFLSYSIIVNYFLPFLFIPSRFNGQSSVYIYIYFTVLVCVSYVSVLFSFCKNKPTHLDSIIPSAADNKPYEFKWGVVRRSFFKVKWPSKVEVTHPFRIWELLPSFAFKEFGSLFCSSTFGIWIFFICRAQGKWLFLFLK